MALRGQISQGLLIKDSIQKDPLASSPISESFERNPFRRADYDGGFGRRYQLSGTFLEVQHTSIQLFRPEFIIILTSSTIDKKLENFEFIFEFKIAINFEFDFEIFVYTNYF